MKLLFPILAIGLASPASQNSIPDLAKLETKFEKLMTGCQMVGKFTMRDGKKPAQQESYTISKVTKVSGSKWRFFAKIQYLGVNVTVPLLVDVKWAGNTPMIQVTKMKIPGIGTYSARVLIYDGEYAGTWSGKNYGGQMFGKIVRAPQDKPNKQDKQARATWGSWRGTDGNAVGTGKPPTEWDEKDGKNIKWQIPIAGRGSSSPIVWGDRVYITTAIDTEKKGSASSDQGGGRRRGGFGGFGSATPTTVYDFVVMALNRKDGSVAWKKKVNSAVPHEGGHATSTQASNSSLTDGKHIWAHFGSRGLHCLDMQGEIKWSKDFGKMRTAASFGEGSSPTLYRDTLVMIWDHEGESFIAALNKETGDELWRNNRRQGTTWATPLVVPVDGKPQVIMPGARSSRAYDLKSGKEIWNLSGLTRNAIPTPLHRNGVIYLMSGFMGSSLQAVKLAGAKGNLRSSDNVVWTYKRNTPYTPTGVVYGDYLYFLRVNSGVLTCLNAETGKVHYEGQRLRRVGTTYSSIVGANGHVYITSRRGWTKVVKVGEDYVDVASNRVRDTVDSTFAIVDDEIYIRGWKNLYCIAEDEKKGE